MSKRKSGKSLHQPDGRGGSYSMLPHSALDAMLVTVSPRAVAIALAILRRFNGYNNGRIGMSMRDVAEAIGSANNPANTAAIAELERTGFIRVIRYPHGQRKANDYSLTFISSGPQGEQPATHDYLAGVETRMETKKSSVSKLDTRNASRVSSFDTRRKHRVSSFDTGATETCGSPDPSPVSISYTHILHHAGGPSGSDGNTHPDASKSPRAVSTNSSGMALPDLRLFARSYLAWAPPGAQSTLAHETKIPGGTLSKFLNGRSLPDHYRMPLQLAVARSFPMEARNADAA